MSLKNEEETLFSNRRRGRPSQNVVATIDFGLSFLLSHFVMSLCVLKSAYVMSIFCDYKVYQCMVILPLGKAVVGRSCWLMVWLKISCITL